MATKTVSTTDLVKRAIAKSGTTARDVVEIVRDARAAVAARGAQLPVEKRLTPAPVDKPVAITKDEAKQFRRFIKLAEEAVGNPGEVRELTDDELDSWLPVWTEVKNVAKVVKRVEESFRTSLLIDNTIKTEAEREKEDAERGDEDEETPAPLDYDAKGFVAKARKYTASTTSAKASVEVKKGPLLMDPATLVALARMEETRAAREPGYVPLFTKEDAKDCVKMVPTRDDDALMEKIAERPELAELLADTATVGAPTVSVSLR